MQIRKLEADLKSRLLDYLTPIFAETCANAPCLAVAVSGGADSMALTLLAKQWCDANQRSLTALTVDHQMRAGSAQEATQVQQWMKARDIAHITLTPDAPLIKNLQSRARTMRYNALTQWGRDHHAVLLVAHHADDQAETLALQSHRGASPPSRSGMALVSMRDGIKLIRPLLGVRKQALIDFLNGESQPWIDDPSNNSDAFARNRLRREFDDTSIEQFWHEAQRQGELRQEQDIARNRWVARYVREDAEGLVIDAKAWRTLEDESRTDLLSRVIRAVGGKQFRPRHHETARLDAQLREAVSGKSTLGHCIVSWQAAGPIRVALEQARKTPHIPLANPLKQLGNEPFWWFNHPSFF